MLSKKRLLLAGLPVLAALVLAGPNPTTRAQAVPGATTAVPVWYDDLGAALHQAQASNKPVLAVFSGSDWCKPCIMLKQEVFDKPEFQRYAQTKLVLVRFDFPRGKKNKLPARQTKRNEQAAAQYNREGAFPLVLLLSPEGRVLARTGYRPGGPAAYDAHLSQLLAGK